MHIRWRLVSIAVWLTLASQAPSERPPDWHAGQQWHPLECPPPESLQPCVFVTPTPGAR